MAKSWADMSKAEREAAGGNKKAYNKSTGQERYAPGGELAHKAAPQPVTRPAPTPPPSSGAKPAPIMNNGKDDVVNRTSPSWSDMSKSDRSATGQTKKEYNRSTGQERYAPGAELAGRSEAKERAQAFTTAAAALNNDHSPK